MINLAKQEIAELMDKFIWSYSVADNICYNFKVLFTLYEDQARSADPQIYNKPIIIFIVSIIECLMYDLVNRLDGATSHYPERIPIDKRVEIAARLTREKQKYEYEHLNQRMTMQRVRNYSMDQLVKIFKEYEFFGSNPLAYQSLQTAVQLRNRIHILNWFGNFDRREDRTYGAREVALVERLLEGVLQSLARNYPRPSSAGQTDNWKTAMTPS
jgi:hypothetical protein